MSGLSGENNVRCSSKELLLTGNKVLFFKLAMCYRIFEESCM